MIEKDDLIQTGQSVLQGNWQGHYTVPNPNLYPYQWNWDSGFAALGLNYIDPELAITELQSLFSGQWDCGLLPHIIFRF